MPIDFPCACSYGRRMGWLGARADGSTSLQRVTRLRPELDDLLQPFLAEPWAEGDAVVLELCRLRIATLHGDRVDAGRRTPRAVAAGLTEEMVGALPQYPTAACFTEHQRRCIAYAEQYVIDVHGITDVDADRVREGMTDAEFVGFTVALGQFDGFGRLRLALDVDGGLDGVADAGLDARTA